MPKPLPAIVTVDPQPARQGSPVVFRGTGFKPGSHITYGHTTPWCCIRDSTPGGLIVDKNGEWSGPGDLGRIGSIGTQTVFVWGLRGRHFNKVTKDPIAETDFVVLAS